MSPEKINPFFQTLSTDYLYHLGIDSSMDIESLFADIKYVIISRRNEEISVIVHEFAKQWYNIHENFFEFKPLFKTERYHLYKIGPVLAISHGMGAQSMLISLNEIAKLLVHAKVYDTIFLKIGPAGSIGLSPGEIVVSDIVMNNQFEPVMETIACGKNYFYPTHVDLNLVHDIVQFGENFFNITLHTGGTMNGFDYYEGQARLNGFLTTPYSEKERDAYLQKAKTLNIKTLDMESLYFAGFCNQLDIQAAIISTVIVDRLKSDDVDMDTQAQLEKERYTAQFISSYIIYQLREKTIS